ncbi:MAG: diaminopimelate dehydrogenase, partial [Clostridia bacterium]|nr:diaminopimelate dehydrogenase [Clostridia bacterium]
MHMRLAIYGYGNLGRGAEAAILNSPDAELVGVFTRRDPNSVQTRTGAKVFAADEILRFRDEIDAVILCGGSATDLPALTPMLAKDFNVIDSFDTHANIPAHFDAVDAAAKAGGKLALISCGWDPGMFSLNRLYASAILPDGRDYTFWGRGVSQGHSDAIRRIPGVLDARQYTVPIKEALEAVRSGKQPELSAREKHLRECYVVPAPDADRAAIEQAIKTMPNYF